MMIRVQAGTASSQCYARGFKETGAIVSERIISIGWQLLAQYSAGYTCNGVRCNSFASTTETIADNVHHSQLDQPSNRFSWLSRTHLDVENLVTDTLPPVALPAAPHGGHAQAHQLAAVRAVLVRRLQNASQPLLGAGNLAGLDVVVLVPHQLPAIASPASHRITSHHIARSYFKRSTNATIAPLFSSAQM
eukprot:9474343-Pyramimonas_sp.AAC.2